MTKHVSHIDLAYETIIIERETAICLHVDGDNHWFPLAGIQMDRDAKLITIPFKMAYQKGLI